ncbi:MAG TPA: tetratricopeptide repeat protein [Desulfobacteria bacterium]|nr:tetratricopeptide repeat protein [Desulfobacteria bacterium]
MGGRSEEIQISSQFREKALQLGRILAHEISHDLLHSRNIWLQTTEENERLTDLASLMLGMGKVVLNGMEERLGIQTLRLGYLSPADMAYAYVKINALYGIPDEKSLTNLTHNALKLVKPLIDERNVKEIRSVIGKIRKKSSTVQSRLTRFKEVHSEIRAHQELINENKGKLDIDSSDGVLFVKLNSYQFQHDSEAFSRQSEREMNEIRRTISAIEQSGMAVDQLNAIKRTLTLFDSRIEQLDTKSVESLDGLLEALYVQERYLNQRSRLIVDRFQELIREKEIKKALSLAVKADCRVLRDVGIEYAKKNNPLAVEIFDKIIQLDPEDARAYYNRGNAYRNLQQYDRAIKDYTTALGVDPTYVNAYINRGNVYSRLERYAEAIADYDSALKLRSSYKAYVNRGNAYLHLNRFSEAIEDFQTALDLDTVDVNNRARDDLRKAFSLLKEKGGTALYAKARIKIFARNVLNSLKQTQNQRG